MASNVSKEHFNYNFKDNTTTDIALLIQAINLIGSNLIGLELGTLKGESAMTILHNCSIKKLYIVDNWKPYSDYLKSSPDGLAAYHVPECYQEVNEFITRNYIKYSGQSEKVEIIKEESMTAVKKIKNEDLDFIFFDAMMTEEQTYREAMAYYSKIKKGGYFMSHDAVCMEQVVEPIKKVKELYSNDNPIHIYANTLVFRV